MPDPKRASSGPGAPGGGRHPRFRRLLDVADGLFDDVRVRAASDHVESGCAPCRDELASIIALRDRVADGPLEAPPRAALRRASRLFVAARVRAGVAVVQRVIATLVMDGRMAAAPALRSAGDGRRLLWTIGELELFATLSSGSRGALLRGQFLPADDEAPAPTGAVRLVRDGRVAVHAELDDDGEFAARCLMPGTYVIEGEVGDVAFASPPFVVDA